MPRIAGIDLPDQKPIRIALRYLYGIGPKNADEIVAEAKVDPAKRAGQLSSDEIGRIQRVVEKHNIEGNLRRMINDNIDRLKRIKSYRGSRHVAGLPARGQRTRSNGRTRKGKRKTIGAMSKEMAAKLDTAKKGA